MLYILAAAVTVFMVVAVFIIPTVHLWGFRIKLFYLFQTDTYTYILFKSFYNLSEYQVLFLTLYFQHYGRKLSYLLYLVLLPNNNIYGK